MGVGVGEEEERKGDDGGTGEGRGERLLEPIVLAYFLPVMLIFSQDTICNNSNNCSIITVVNNPLDGLLLAVDWLAQI